MSAPQFSLDDLRLLVEEAHRAGVPVTAHSHAAAGIDQAIAVGVEGIEHGSYLVAGDAAGLPGLLNVHATDQQLEALAASGIPVCPTSGGLTPEFYRKVPPHVQQMMAAAGVTPEQIVETRMGLLHRQHRAGVRFVSGTDAGIVPAKAHGLFANAVVELAPVLTVPEALATATSAAAVACGLGASKGRLRAGYDADVLIVEGDLSQDVSALRRVRQVVLRGSVVTPSG